MITWTTAIGLTAAVFTTISFLPQVIKTWRTKSASDLSLVMYTILCTGVILWGIYGLILGDLPIMLGNAVTLVLAGSILFFILRDRIGKDRILKDRVGVGDRIIESQPTPEANPNPVAKGNPGGAEIDSQPQHSVESHSAPL